MAQEGLEYPELLSAPRATERVRQEAAHEHHTRWFTHWPVQVSALATIAASAVHKDKPGADDSYADVAGYAVGGGWLLTTGLLSAFYQPYRSAYNATANLPTRTVREQVVRERLAESHIDQAADLGVRLQWISAATNLAASVYLTVKSEGGSTSQVIGGVSSLLSLTPLLFSYRWSRVSSEQQSYKKKIYGPLTDLGASPQVYASRAGTMAYGFGLAASF